ncbi:Glycosyl transferase, group 2 family protein [Candidatus Accumulibacter phosphatis]|uniref:Glycosyl transferase, group 2 family protein n=1 Tax=Candidatus Accumulibacter phosphatis TaxID=327160 RepID=A0A5S4EH53_9PROT|nr:Glycosyl transferase, group 2 family protein [Candidatus Accumulibacter phosphatis]
MRILRNVRLKGPAGGRNTGIQAAKGELVAFLDSDDAFLPGHLAEAWAAFQRFPELEVLFGRARYERDGLPEEYMGANFDRKLEIAQKTYSDESLSVFSPDFFAHLLEYGCWFNLSTVVMRAGAARERMEESLRIAEDYEFWVRLARHRRFGCLHGHQIRYTLHEGNISFEASETAEGNAPQLFRAYQMMLGYPGLTRAQRRLIEDRIATLFFEWAYRSKTHGLWLESASLHARSMRYGRIGANLVALAKLPLSLLASGIR